MGVAAQHWWNRIRKGPRRGLRWSGAAPDGDQQGQVGILLVGLIVMIGALVVVVVDVTAVQLARVRFCDAADAAAVAAANEVSLARLYASGAGARLPLDDDAIRHAAERHLRTAPRPDHVVGWRIAEGTGSPDGFTARVVVTGAVRLPLTAGDVLDLPGPVTVTAEGSAQAMVTPSP